MRDVNVHDRTVRKSVVRLVSRTFLLCRENTSLALQRCRPANIEIRCTKNSHTADLQSHTESHHFYLLKLNMFLQSTESLLLVFFVK